MSKKRGDRKDGTWIRDVDGFHFIMPHMMPNRCDAEVYIEEHLDVTNLMAYLKEKSGEGAPYKTTLFHVFVTAIAKTVYHRPMLNRFIIGKRLYQRNKITFGFTVKRKFEDHAEESLLITPVDGETTLEQISRRILGDTKQIRSEDGNSMNDILDAVSHLPRWLMRIVKRGYDFLDYHGWVPDALWKTDPSYTTVMLSNLGSIKCNAAYHHLNNYGTNSIVITIGKVHKEQVIDEEGNAHIRDIVNIGATVDERIADGFYFAKSIRLLENILQNPAQLELPIKTEME